MTNLTLFWGSKEERSFSWRRSEIQQPDLLNPNFLLEHQDILKDDLACIADMAESHQVTLVLSSVDVLITQVEMPNKAQRVLRKVIPFMLEDDVANSVNEMFFAFSTVNKNTLLSVRAIERSYLDSLIDVFKQAEISLNKIIIDIDLIKNIQSDCQQEIKVIINNERCLIIDSKNNRWQCHKDDFIWMLEKQINLFDTDEALPVAIPLVIYTNNMIDKILHQLPVGRFATEVIQQEDILELLLQNQAAGINLLQAEYEVKKENSKQYDLIKKMLTMAALLFVTFIFYQSVLIYTASKKIEQLAEQKHTLYSQAFPNKKKSKRPFKNMKSFVSSLGSSNKQTDFLSFLDGISLYLTDSKKIKPTNISYENIRNELKMDVIASDLDVLDQYVQTLKSKGFQVDKSSETQRGDGYSSRLIIRQ